MQGEPAADAAAPLPLDAYVGTYTNVLYGEVTVREAPDGLTMELGANPIDFGLDHWDRDSFTYSRPGDLFAPFKFSVVFAIGRDGVAETATVQLVSANPDTTAAFTRVTNP